MPAATAPWRRPPPETEPPLILAYPPPAAPDPGPRGGVRQVIRLAAATAVAYAPAVTPPGPAVQPAPGAWQPAGLPAAAPPPAAPAPRTVTWDVPMTPIALPASTAGGTPQVTSSDDPAVPAPAWGQPGLDFEINFDPPPESAGTGLQQTMPDGSWVVHPLSRIHPGHAVGDEGPINEAFLSTPVVHLYAGQAYALSSPVVIPNGATLYLNRAAIDRTMIHAGEGATIYD